MSTAAERSAEDAYKAQNDAYSGDVGVGDDPAYRGSGIVSDREAVGGMASMSGDVTNSDAQLRKYPLPPTDLKVPYGGVDGRG